MIYAEAFRLVHAKFREEISGMPTGPIADAYKRACQEYPAVMTIAHYAVAVASEPLPTPTPGIKIEEEVEEEKE